MKISCKRFTAGRSFVSECCHYGWWWRRIGSTTLFQFMFVVFGLLRGRHQWLESFVHFIIVVETDPFAVRVAQVWQCAVHVGHIFNPSAGTAATSANATIIGRVHILRVAWSMRQSSVNRLGCRRWCRSVTFLEQIKAIKELKNLKKI